MALGWRRGYLRYKRFFLDIATIYDQRQDVKAFLELFLSLGAISVFGLFALRPTLLTIAKLYREIQAKEEMVVQLNQKAQNLVQAQTIYNQQRERIGLLDFSIPDKPAPELFVRQIEGLVGKHNVEILGLSIGKATLLGTSTEEDGKAGSELPEKVGGISFSLSAKGNYSSIFSFLSDFESLRRPVKVETFTINASETEGDDVLILVLTGQVPYFKQL